MPHLHFYISRVSRRLVAEDSRSTWNGTGDPSCPPYLGHTGGNDGNALAVSGISLKEGWTHCQTSDDGSYANR